MFQRLLILHGGMLMIQQMVFHFMIKSMWTEVYSDSSIYYKLFALTIIAFGGFVVLDFCFKFMLMVVSYYTANFYWVGYRIIETRQYINLLSR